MRFFGVLLSLLLATPCFATTIAWDGKTLACDSQRSGGHLKIFVGNKMVRSEKRHAVMAGGGEVRITAKIKKFFVETEQPLSECPLPEKMDPDSFAVLVIYDNGEAEFYQGDLVRAEVIEAPFAFGTGGEFALTVMHLGKSAEQAVKVAEEMDLFTGGAVHVIAAPAKK